MAISLPDDDEINAWLTSTPSTKIVATRDLSYFRTTSGKQFMELTAQSPKRSPRIHRAVKSLPSIEDMIDEPFSSDSSDASLEEKYRYLAEEGWDDYWSSPDSSPSYTVITSIKPTRSQNSNLSPDNRNNATLDFSQLTCPKSSNELHRSDAIRTSRQILQTHTARPHNYSPFPPVAPPPPASHQARRTWPQRGDSRQNRARANTTPSRPPSNLSICSTVLSNLEPHSRSTSSGASSPLYMSSRPRTPHFNHQPSALSEIEKAVGSCFDDSDDEKESTSMRLKHVFHIRSGSSNHEGAIEAKEEEKPRDRSLRKMVRMRKSLSDAAERLEGVFRGRGREEGVA